MIVSGSVAPGYEPIKALYEHNMRTLAERNTQLCIYVGETCVVDLWASGVDDATFSPDLLVNVFSSGKSLEAILLAMLVDRGLLDYDARIADYWPEFAANGKQETTVADLMRHEAGLAAFDTTLDPRNLHADRLVENAVGAIIERQSPRFREGPDNRREYHAITRGWVANELFRRVDPAGRTMGQALREDISTPLEADVYIGLREDELSRLSPVAMLGFGYQAMQSVIPKALGRRMELNLAQTATKLWRMRAGIRDGTRRKAPPPLSDFKKIAAIDADVFSRAEIPSAGAKCTARGLARLAAAMANGGRFGERRLLGETGYRALHEAAVRGNMMALNTTFTQGGLAAFESQPADGPLDVGLSRGREGFFGWMGLGGSIFQWHPDKRIGFAYVPTSLNVLDIVNERGKAYQAAVLQCVDASGSPP